jgi:signal transduction histidine kinase
MKLAAALAVPLVALTTVTFLEVARTSDDVADIREQTAMARAAIGPSGLITKLQNERTWMSVEVVGWGDSPGIPVKGYAETRSQTDEAAAMLREEIEREGGEVERAFAPALDGLAALDQIRADIDAYTGPADTTGAAFTGPTYDRYSAVITPFFDAITDVSVAVDDPDLRQGTELADAVAREIEVLGDTMAQILGEQLVNGSIGVEGLAWTAGKQEEFVRYGQKLQNATGSYADIVAAHFPANLYEDVGVHLDQAITAGSIDIAAVQASVLDREDGEGFEVLQSAIATELLDRSSDLNAAAVARQRWYAALGGLTLVLATILTWLVSRSITKPLRSLTHQAKEMAEHRLPDAVLDILETPLGDDVAMPSIDPVRVNTRDEVADVADALNTVQDTALDLAVEQAVLRRNIADSFVNLGRRNQNLLGRQLDFITELETNEADPDTLANLFRLDHLATRMRRNAESLLVLAGIEPPRKWAAPVRLTDVIRAALGEVEDYQRVTVRGVEPATILGSAAADLAHLLAELIENALVFSPPDQTVDIRGRNRPDGYTLAIIDSGLGMPATDVNAANRRLAGAESFTIAPSKYLGHYVAGNLAARHNIHVHLDNSPGNGITATIDIPPTLLTTDERLAPELTPPSGTRRALLPITGTGLSPVVPPEPAPEPEPLLWPASVEGWDAPPVPDAAPYTPPPAMIPPPPVEGSRTQSGLVKRSPAHGLGTTVGADDPSGDLLDALSRHSANLQRGTGDGTGPRARTGLWGPQDEPVSRDRPPLAPRRTPPPVDLVPPAPTLDPYGPPGGDVTHPTLDPYGPPRGDVTHPTLDPYGPPGGDVVPPAPGPYLPPEQPMQSPPPTPLGPDVPVWQPAPPVGDRPLLPPRVPEPAAERPRFDPGAGGVTSSGLTRRVRGAQLPNPEPLLLRRSGADASGTGNGALAPERTPEQRRRADDVYGFLSSFTAGVRRGLQEQPAERRRNGDR